MTQEEDLLEVSSETLVLQDLVWGLEQGEVAEVVVVVVDLAEVVLDEAWVRSGVWLRVGLCVLNFLSILSGFRSREKLTQKGQKSKAEPFPKVQFLNNKIDQLQSAKRLIIIAQLLTLFFVSVSLMREKSERIER